MKFKYGIIFALIFILFFIDFPQIFASRSLDRIADFTHIIIFALLVTMAIRYFNAFHKFSPGRQFWYILIFTILLSMLIEFLQFFSHRTPDIGDILRNILGAGIGFVYAYKMSLRRKPYFKIVMGLLLLCVCFELYFVVRAVSDDTRARINFPVLADFESSYEIDRWEGRAEYKIVDNISKSGAHALQVKFLKDAFSDISLIHFPGDWQDYANLALHIFNTGQDTVTLFIRIYDIGYHETKSEEKFDRYNSHFRLDPGWNTITIPIEEIIAGPKMRKIDITHLTRIRLFTQFLPADRVLYFDYFRLN